MNRKREINGESDNEVPVTKKGKCKAKSAQKQDKVLVTLNPVYTDAGRQKKFETVYQGSETHVIDGFSVCHEPFTHCILQNYIEDEEFLTKLQEELLDLTFAERNNDLYKFYQWNIRRFSHMHMCMLIIRSESKEDLKVIQSPYISALRDLIYITFKEWLQKVTGIPLNDKVDMSCAKYEFTDTLLCHDDELEGRRIAFIYYFVPASWSKEDGGALELFTINEDGQPTDIVKSIVPVRNNFAFFEVTPVSFHQVSEVLSEDKSRLSISGWFHGPPVQRPPAFVEPHLTLIPAVNIEEDVFFDWINPTYLDMVSQADIRERFEEESQIELQNFLKKSKFEELKVAIQTCEKWAEKGPANKRCYSVLCKEDTPQIVLECQRLLQSDAMFLVLSNLTGLKLHELAPKSDSDESDNQEEPNTNGAKGEPCCCIQVRRWRHGCYTLVHDTDLEGERDFALDVLLYVDCEGWEPDQGGTTSYIASGEDEELLSVNPLDNSLALVYRGRDTLHFVKHLNTKCNQLPNREFYDISCTYYE